MKFEMYSNAFNMCFNMFQLQGLRLSGKLLTVLNLPELRAPACSKPMPHLPVTSATGTESFKSLSTTMDFRNYCGSARNLTGMRKPTDNISSGQPRAHRMQNFDQVLSRTIESQRKNFHEFAVQM